MKIFDVKPGLGVVCEWKKTRTGFKHEATLFINDQEAETVKICYVNRTWESFEYESVLKKLFDHQKDLITAEERKNFFANGGSIEHERVKAQFKTTATVAALGDLFGQTTKDKNAWKERMLKAGLPGLEIPAEWSTLTEEERGKRLDAAIAFAKKEA